jgi:acid phosphatase
MLPARADPTTGDDLRSGLTVSLIKGKRVSVISTLARLASSATLMLALVVSSGISQAQTHPCSTATPKNLGNGTLQSVRSTQSGATWTGGRKFDGVLIVVLENQDYQAVVKHPVMKKLRARGSSFSNFSGTFHPSYANYLSMVGGTYFGTASDAQIAIDPGHRTIGDLLKAKQLTWAQYAEGYPGNCFTGPSAEAGQYQRKHVPFLSFRAVSDDPQQCANVVPAAQFDRGKLPNYALYSPDICHDGHGGAPACKYPPAQMIELSMQWLDSFLAPILNDPVAMAGTLVVITFDESSNYAHNRIVTLFLGPMVKSGYTNRTCLDHYNVLRTIEDNFALGTLGGEDAQSSPITSVWK